MTGAEIAIIALVAGSISGAIAGGVVGVFNEAYFGRRAQEQVGAYDKEEQF